MNNQDLVRRLSALAQMDIDITHAYSQVAGQVEDETLRYNLNRFRRDHERHVARLSSHIRDLGGEAPKHARDLRGLLMEGVTALSGFAGMRGTLEALRANEKWIHGHYEEVRKLHLPQEIRALLEEHFGDETEHLNYLGQAIRHGYWQK
jgi:rubrerythrin